MGTGEPVVMESAELVIADFDGTLVDLPIDWMALRERLAVRSIDQLFAEGRDDDWVIVRDAETQAAQVGAPRRDVIDSIRDARGVAVLTANSEEAVEVFLEREPELARRIVGVVGRETARGPKREQSVFNASYRRCIDMLSALSDAEVRPLYLGDQDYELAFAAELGAVVRDVRASGDARMRNAL